MLLWGAVLFFSGYFFYVQLHHKIAFGSDNQMTAAGHASYEGLSSQLRHKPEQQPSSGASFGGLLIFFHDSQTKGAYIINTTKIDRLHIWRNPLDQAS